MCDSLCVRCDSIVLLSSKIDHVRVETREDFFDQSKALLGCAMLDQCQGLTLGIDLRSMQGMARDDLDVFRQVCFEGSYLNLFTGSLASDNGALLSRCINVSMKIAELHDEAYRVHIRSRFDRWPLLQRCTG